MQVIQVLQKIRYNWGQHTRALSLNSMILNNGVKISKGYIVDLRKELSMLSIIEIKRTVLQLFYGDVWIDNEVNSTEN